MPNTQSGASMTHEEIEVLVNRRVAEEMEAHDAAMNLETLNEDGDEQEGENGGNGNEGNGNGGNGNRGNALSFKPSFMSMSFDLRSVHESALGNLLDLLHIAVNVLPTPCSTILSTCLLAIGLLG
ncbi:hypothetical protein Tco_1523041 [Tanacetum coccineum]